MDPDPRPAADAVPERPAKRGLDETLRGALAAEGKRLEALSDPVDVLREATDFFSVLDAEVAELIGTVRLRAMGDLRRQGWSHQQIADACGLTRQRVSQLISEAARILRG